MYKIQKKIPMPPIIRKSGSRRVKYPLEDMEVGEWLFAPDKKPSSVSTYISAAKKKLPDRKYKTRQCYMRSVDKGVWEPAEAEDADAVLGVGIWRTK